MGRETLTYLDTNVVIFLHGNTDRISDAAVRHLDREQTVLISGW